MFNDDFKLFRSVLVVPIVLAIAGCIRHERLDVSNSFAPVNLSDGSATVRRATYVTRGWDTQVVHEWLTSSGKTISSDDVVAELDDFLGFTGWGASVLSDVPIREAAWYWNPDLACDQDAHQTTYARRETVVVLGVNPTVAVCIERPTEVGSWAVHYARSQPWWGWDRFCLLSGVADGVAIPLLECGDSHLANARLVMPSTSVSVPVDLRYDGSVGLDRFEIRWRRTQNGGRDMMLFSAVSFGQS